MSAEFDRKLRAKIDGKAKPVGALGQLERIALKVASLKRQTEPQMRSATLFVIASDHGIADEGVSAFGGSVRDTVRTLAAGGAAVNILSREAGLTVKAVDAGVRGGSLGLSAVEDRRLGNGTASFAHGPAMTQAQLDAALDHGAALAQASSDDAVGFGELARGSSSSATLIVHRLTGYPIEGLVGRGAGLDEDGLFRKHQVLRASSGRVAEALDPRDVLREFGGFEIAMMVGGMIAAARDRKLVLVDGYVSAVAALVAAQIAAKSRPAMLFSHLSREPGHRVILDALAANPLLQLDVSLGEGTGIALAWPIVRGAVAVFKDMADRPEDTAP